jgi:hypothetical protein
MYIPEEQNTTYRFCCYLPKTNAGWSTLSTTVVQISNQQKLETSGVNRRQDPWELYLKVVM